MSDSKPDIIELMQYLAKVLVEAPDEVTVEPFEENGQTVLELVVAEEDVGRVIGRHGRTARSLRTILHSASLRTRKRYQLEILE